MIKDGKILVNEIFESIDGEGYHAGKPTVFFRVVGCNLRCKWCDSVYTFLPEDTSKWMDWQTAFDAVDAFGIKHVTITGGEPLIPANKVWMMGFIDMLLREGYSVDIETNGSIEYHDYKKKYGRAEITPTGDHTGVTLITDWKAPSSGMSDRMIKENLAILDDTDIVKIVVEDTDFDEVENLIGKTKAMIYISPVFGKVTMERIPEFVMKHKNDNVTAQIQMHKVFWDPNKRGV